MRAADAPMKDYDEMTERIRKVKGVAMALPMIEGAAGVSSPYGQTGALVRGVREADLEKLPGVGRKTANVVLNIAFGIPTIAVDTHVFRVSQRLGLAKGKTPLAIEEQLLKVVPPKYLQHAHHWLILHGRYTCIARKPKCPECSILDLCPFKPKTES